MDQAHIEAKAEEQVNTFFQNGWLTCFGKGVHLRRNEASGDFYWRVDDFKAKDIDFDNLVEVGRWCGERIGADFPREIDRAVLTIADEKIKRNAANSLLFAQKIRPSLADCLAEIPDWDRPSSLDEYLDRLETHCRTIKERAIEENKQVDEALKAHDTHRAMRHHLESQRLYEIANKFDTLAGRVGFILTFGTHKRP